MCNKKDYLWQFLPREFEYLTKIKKIVYKGKNLKTDYLINMMHELSMKYYFTNDVTHNLWSEILRSRYTKLYNYYIDYLVEHKYMFYVSNYYVGKKAKTYKLNITDLDMIKCKINDPIILKKHSKDYLYETFTKQQNSPIELELRKLLIEDLYHVEIDYNSALKYLTDGKSNGTLESEKYFRNLYSIDGINTNHIFFKFDNYGRFHTNFTVLKREIRHNNLTIDGEKLAEIDISNSQPFFFAVFLKNEIGVENFNDEIRRYVDCVKNGLIYDEILQKFPNKVSTRHEAKTLMYKLLFGNNFDSKKECKIFSKLYPSVYEYIKEYKYFSESYKSLSHELQSLESDFIFNKVVSEIKKKFPHIKLFTVHDSIVFPEKYKIEVELIFNKYLKELI